MGSGNRRQQYLLECRRKQLFYDLKVTGNFRSTPLLLCSSLSYSMLPYYVLSYPI